MIYFLAKNSRKRTELLARNYFIGDIGSISVNKSKPLLKIRTK